jgi:hypothetical protein
MLSWSLLWAAQLAMSWQTLLAADVQPTSRNSNQELRSADI